MKNVKIVLLIIFFSRIGHASDSQIEQEACERAIASTKRLCLSSKIATQMLTLLNAYEVYKSSGDMGEACAKAAQITQVSVLGNAIYARSCGNSARSCKRACQGNALSYVCEGYEDRADLARIQSVISAQHLAQSKTCVTITQSKCEGSSLYSNSECAGFCSHPFNRAHIKCAQIETLRVAANINTDVLNPDTHSFQPISPILITEKSYDVLPNDLIPNEANVLQPEELSNPFSANTNSSFVVDDNKNAEPTEKLKKEILLPSNFIPVGHSVNWSSSGGTKEVTEDYVFDLNAFLPKSGKGLDRKIASIKDYRSAITPANGLSNFQKVSRKLREKRSELMP